MIAALSTPTTLPVRLLGAFCLLAMVVCASSAQTDVDNASKKLNVLLTGVDNALRTNVEGFLELYAFNDKVIPSVARLRYLHNKAEDQIAAALRPFGYYRPTIETELVDVGTKWQAVYRVNPNDRIRVVSDPVLDLANIEVDCDDFRYQQRDRRSCLLYTSPSPRDS